VQHFKQQEPITLKYIQWNIITMIKLFVIIDGLGDKQSKELNNKTPLELANIPNLNYFAKEGCTGLIYTISKKIAHESDQAVWALLGNDPKKDYPGRWPLEAYGAGISFKDGYLILRANFATYENNKIIDRRVGRSLTTKEAKKLAKAINKKVKLKYSFKFIPTIGHRSILIIHGKFSSKISNTDPAYKKVGKLESAKITSNLLQKCKPLDKSNLSKETAEIINDFVKQSSIILNENKINKKRQRKGLLKANLILLRDAGNKVPKSNKRFLSWAAIVGMPLEKGIAKLHGMNILSYKIVENKNKDYYSSLYKTLNNAIKSAKEYISKMQYPCYFVHFKEVDIPGHDGKPLDKKEMLELIDKEFFSYIRKIKDIQLVVTGDHSTPCSLKSHSSDPVPLLWYGKQKDRVEKFSEKECKNGSLVILYGKDIMKKTSFIHN